MPIGPPDRVLSRNLQAIAGGLEDILKELYGEKVGFILVLSPLNRKTPEVQYIANVDRADATNILRTLKERWDTTVPDVPAHLKQ